MSTTLEHKSNIKLVMCDEDFASLRPGDVTKLNGEDALVYLVHDYRTEFLQSSHGEDVNSQTVHHFRFQVELPKGIVPSEGQDVMVYRPSAGRAYEDRRRALVEAGLA